MTGEQIIGVIAIVIGVYLVVCATMAKNFVLYRMKSQHAAAIFGERTTHLIYAILGIILALVGAVKAAGVF
jgi:drug/metabolite transporter (DMT)-like permease